MVVAAIIVEGIPSLCAYYSIFFAFVSFDDLAALKVRLCALPAPSMETARDADNAPALRLPRLEDVEKEIAELLANLQDLGSTTLKDFWQTLCERLGLPANGLETMRDAVLEIVQRCLCAKTRQEAAAGEHAELGEELPTFRSWVYLATVANLRPETLAADQTLQDVGALSRQDIARSFRDAFDNPLQNGKGGRPCARKGPVVRRLVVVRESHSSGLPHFHVALRLRAQRCFLPAKKTLRARHGLAVHFFRRFALLCCAHVPENRSGSLPHFLGPVAMKRWTSTS